MTQEDISKTCSFLKDRVNFEQACQLTEFEGFRRLESGTTQKVKVRIFDSGIGTPHRYYIQAEADDGRRISGPPHDDLDVALAIVPWSDLDA